MQISIFATDHRQWGRFPTTERSGFAERTPLAIQGSPRVVAIAENVDRSILKGMSRL